MNELVFERKRPFSFFIVWLFLLLILMSYQATDPASHRRVLINVLFHIFSPVQTTIVKGVDGIVHAFQTYVNLVGTNKENEQLRKENTQLKIRMAATAHEQGENARLREILHLKDKLPFQLIAGELAGRDSKSPVSDTFTVNRGRGDGIQVETPVVTPAGVVGMVILVSWQTSKIQLITDPSSSVGAMLQRNRASGILVGMGNGLCLLRFLPLVTELKKGDTVVSSGQDGIFPEGLLIGKVSRFIQESELYKSAEIIPSQNFSSLREVIFIQQTVNPNPQDK